MKAPYVKGKQVFYMDLNNRKRSIWIGDYESNTTFEQLKKDFENLVAEDRERDTEDKDALCSIALLAIRGYI